MKQLIQIITCLAIFHSPDGSLISIDTNHIVAVRPAESVKQHIAPGIKTIIYTGGQNFGVAESPEEVGRIIDECT